MILHVDEALAREILQIHSHPQLERACKLSDHTIIDPPGYAAIFRLQVIIKQQQMDQALQGASP